MCAYLALAGGVRIEGCGPRALLAAIQKQSGVLVCAPVRELRDWIPLVARGQLGASSCE